MYELIQAGKNTYYIDCPTKMGIYKISEKDVCLIDSGNDKDAGKKVIKLLEANEWNLKLILSTHSHADHIGGNRLLQQRLGCPVYAAGIDAAFTESPILEPSFLYGGYPFKELRNKFLKAQESEVRRLTPEFLPQGLEMLSIDGHSFSMSAFKTDDDIWFMADCLTSKAIIEKYHISFVYDVRAYLDTLEKVKGLNGRLFIPAHAEPTEDIVSLAEINEAKIREVIEAIKKTCTEPSTFEDILQKIFQHYSLSMDYNQYVLVGSTIRSYLSYLSDQETIKSTFHDNKLYWSLQETV